MDPHDEYHVHKESPDFGKRNRDRYDSEVFFTDLHIGRLLEFAKSQPWWANTAVIVSADHGEAFGEHGMYRHAFELWEVLTRVPLLIYLPNGTPRVIDQRRSHVDMAPTILELMGVAAPQDTFVGKSLVPELDGAAPDDREPIVLDLPEDSHNPPRRAVIQGDYKLTVWGKGNLYQLFNLKTDPGEDTDLAKKEPEQLAKMKELFDSVWDKIPQIQPFGGMKLKNGGTANGPSGPAQEKKP
jgi:arylsulfatase A-like enzyme